MKRRTLIFICILLLLCMSGCQRSSTAENFDWSTLEVSAVKSVGEYLAAEDGFHIEGDGLTKEILEENLRISSVESFTVKAVGSGFAVVPNEEIPADQLVQVTYVDETGAPLRSWAFQTQNVFRITGSYPADGYGYVEPTSGINLYFSHADVDLAAVEAAFRITPAVSGTWEQHGENVLFIPDQALSPNTDYTVEIDASLSDRYGEKLEEAYLFSFKTGSGSEQIGFYSAPYQLDNFAPDAAPNFQLMIEEDMRELSVDVSIFRYRTADRFREDLQMTAAGEDISVNKLQLHTEFSAVPYVDRDNWQRPSYVRCPEALPEGFYLARFLLTDTDGREYTLDRFFQVSPFSVYTAADEDEVLFWVNSSISGGPTAKAAISVMLDDMTAEARTDNSGVAILPLEKEGRWLAEVNWQNNTFFLFFHTGYAGSSDAAKNYYAYLYTSREMYLLDDTVQVWGYVVPRNGSIRLPETVTVSLGDIQSMEVPVAENGSFSCEFTYENLAPTYTDITAAIGDDPLTSKGILIQAYEKPIYTMEIELEKQVYFAHELGSIPVSAQVSFFDGTGAANMPLSMSSLHDSRQFVCDDSGNVSFSLSYDRNDPDCWPQMDSLYLNTVEADNVSTYAWKELILFLHDVMVEPEAKIDDAGHLTLTLGAYEIDGSGIETREDLYGSGYDYSDAIRGEAYDSTFRVELVRSWYEKIPTGSYYNYIYQENIETFDYQYMEEWLGSYTMETVDGLATLGNLPATEENSRYTFTISGQDRDGYPIEIQAHAWGSSFGAEDQHSRLLSFQVNDEDGFADGEDLEIEILNNWNTFRADDGGQFLSVLRQDTFYQPELHTGNSFTLPYNEANIPNAQILGAYYADGEVYEIYQTGIYFDTSERRLQVEILPEAESYAPGDEIVCTVRVTDAAGKPVRDAALCVSISDEAAFAVHEQKVDFAAELFRGIDWGWTSTYTSRDKAENSYAMDAGAEMGEGGGGEFRREFVDDLFFQTLTTDRRGEATVTLKLADNLTGWRVTALAASGQYAGNGSTTIAATLPMFLSANITPVFLEGDSVSFGVRTYGNAIAAEDTVAYTAVLLTADGEEVAEKTASAAAGRNTFFGFGTLESGDYLIRLSGTVGQYADGVELPFRVTDTRAEMWLTAHLSAKDVNNLDVQKYPVILTLSNAAFSTYNRVLDVVYSVPAVRSDEIAARHLAASILAELTEEEAEYTEKLPDITMIKSTYGWLGELPASSGSVLFSARMAAAAPELVNKPELISCFYAVLEDPYSTAADVTAAYLGLAALEQPVLIELRAFLQENQQYLSEYDLLRIMEAFALLGSFQEAEELYSTYVTPNLATLHRKDGSDHLRYAASDRETENVEPTAMAAATAAIIHHEDADALMEYLIYTMEHIQSTPELRYYPLTELMLYLTHYVPLETENAVVTYMLDGEKQTVELERRGFTCIRFYTAEAYENARIKVTKGDVDFHARYMGSIAEISDLSDPSLYVTKVMPESVNIGETVTVELTVEAAEPCVVVVEDELPSGFRLADNTDYVDGQTVRFWLWLEDGSETVTYRMRAVSPGSFIAEQPTAVRIDNALTVTGERDTVTVVAPGGVYGE